MPLPHFAGSRALILHRPDRNREALVGQLQRIGLTLAFGSPFETGATPDADVVFFDADTGHDRLFPWRQGAPPMPLIAILSSEAPGRLEWALAQGATSFLMKPIGSNGAFNALVVATRLFAEMRSTREAAAALSERVRARPAVVRAMLAIMRRHDLDEAQAAQILRHAAMAARKTVEALAVEMLTNPGLLAAVSRAQFRPAERDHAHTPSPPHKKRLP